jgi:hypothetical protein
LEIHAKFIKAVDITLDASAARKHLFAKRIPEDYGRLASRHVKMLHDTMKLECFIPQLVSLVSVKLGKELYSINGQHTCWSVMWRDYSQPGFSIPARMLTFEAKTMDDLRELYTKLDRAKPRSEAYVANLSSDKLSQAFGFNLPPSVCSLVCKAYKAAYVEDVSLVNSLSVDSTVSLMKDGVPNGLRDATAFLLSDAVVGYRKVLARSFVLASMALTFDKRPQVAASFWKAAGGGLGIPEDGQYDPRRYAYKMLEDEKTTIALSHGNGRKWVRLMSLLIAYWNAFRAGEKLKSKLRVPASRPEVAD